MSLACVASVSVRLSITFDALFAFLAAGNWCGRKKVLPSVLRSPAIFAQPKSKKRLQRAESPTETLATQATMSPTLSYA